MLSRTGRAVGVDAAGQVVGVTSYERLRAAIQSAEQAADEQAGAPGRKAASAGSGAAGGGP